MLQIICKVKKSQRALLLDEQSKLFQINDDFSEIIVLSKHYPLLVT